MKKSEIERDIKRFEELKEKYAEAAKAGTVTTKDADINKMIIDISIRINKERLSLLEQ